MYATASLRHELLKVERMPRWLRERPSAQAIVVWLTRAMVWTSVAFNSAMAFQWWGSSTQRSSSPAFAILRHWGAAVYSDEPMWLWAALFSLAAVSACTHG
jgi:hypothetical protein